MDRIAISTYAALRTLFNAGHDTDEKLSAAQSELLKLKPATAGYYYADDVSNLVEQLK